MVRGKAVEHRAVLAVRLVVAFGDDADHGFIGHQLALVDQRLAGQAQRGARGNGGTQHVTGGKLRQAALGGENLGLRALARPRRAEQNQVHLRVPRSFDFLSRPSYCWATRWLWICATVSMVTLTTIRMDVPPSAKLRLYS